MTWDLTALERETAETTPGPSCRVGALLDRLPPAERDAIVEAFRRHGTISTSVLHRALAREHGFIALSTVQRHRKNVCKCAQKT